MKIINKAERLSRFNLWRRVNKMKGIVLAICFSLPFIVMSGLANATDLRSVDYSSLQRDKVRVTLTFSEDVNEPTIFSIDD